jgi:hypothetical protein
MLVRQCVQSYSILRRLHNAEITEKKTLCPYKLVSEIRNGYSIVVTISFLFRIIFAQDIAKY